MILHFSQIGFTEDLTFTSFHSFRKKSVYHYNTDISILQALFWGIFHVFPLFSRRKGLSWWNAGLFLRELGRFLTEAGAHDKKLVLHVATLHRTSSKNDWDARVCPRARSFLRGDFDCTKSATLREKHYNCILFGRSLMRTKGCADKNSPRPSRPATRLSASVILKIG